MNGNPTAKAQSPSVLQREWGTVKRPCSVYLWCLRVEWDVGDQRCTKGQNHVGPCTWREVTSNQFCISQGAGEGMQGLKGYVTCNCYKWIIWLLHFKQLEGGRELLVWDRSRWHYCNQGGKKKTCAWTLRSVVESMDFILAKFLILRKQVCIGFVIYWSKIIPRFLQVDLTPVDRELMQGGTLGRKMICEMWRTLVFSRFSCWKLSDTKKKLWR